MDAGRRVLGGRCCGGLRPVRDRRRARSGGRGQEAAASRLVSALRVGVLGTGRIGRMHAELIARRVPGAELVAVYDVDRSTATTVAGGLGVDAATDVGELVASVD